MKLSDIMAREVEVVSPQDTLQDAAQKLRQRNVGFLLVYKDDQAAGVLTDRDIILRAIANGANPRNARVQDFMTTPVVYCFEDEDIDHVADLMQDHQIRRVVVLSHEHEQLVGVVSLGDLATNGSRQLSSRVLESVSAQTD